MPHVLQKLILRRRWSIVIGSGLGAIAIFGAAAALWLQRPDFQCSSAWETIGEDVEQRYCTSTPRAGQGEESRFAELRIQRDGEANWYLEQPEWGALVEQTDEVLLVRSPRHPYETGSEDREIVAYRISDGQRLWGSSLPWTHEYRSEELPCLESGPVAPLLAELDGRLIFLGSRPDERFAFALDATSGATLWERSLDSIGMQGAATVQNGALLIPSRTNDVFYRIDRDGNVSASTLPMRSAASCLEQARHPWPLDPALARWLEDGEARIDCAPAGPRTLAVARAGSRMRVLLLSPDGDVRFKDEQRGVHVRLPFDMRCRDLSAGRDYIHRTIPWLEQVDEEPWELVLLDTRLRRELRFGLPDWEPSRSEVRPWEGGFEFEGTDDAGDYHRFAVPRGEPHIALHGSGSSMRFEPDEGYDTDIIVAYQGSGYP